MSKYCFDYSNFGACPRRNCTFGHLEETPRQEFFIARIVSIPQGEKGKIVIDDFKGNGQLKFWLQSGLWHSKAAEPGDLVVFQKSEVGSSGIHKGRVLTIFTKKHLDIRGPTNFPVINAAFTLDPPQTKLYDDAISIEECSETDCNEKKLSGEQKNEGCKKIGIHIAAPSLARLPLQELNCYPSVPTKKYENSLEKDKYHLVISVYLHTNSDRMHGPEISVAKVVENFKIFDDKYGYRKHMKVLWSYFEKLAYGSIARTVACKFLLESPKSWKESFVVGETMAAFNRIVTKFIMESPKCNAFFITTLKNVTGELVHSEKIMAPKTLFENARNDLCADRNPNANERNEELLTLVAACNRIHHIKSKNPNPFIPGTYERDVEDSSDMNEDRLVRSTSPLRNFNDYVNLQVFIHCLLINPTKLIYQKNELLGILGIRFKTPIFRHIAVRELNEKSFVVSYFGEYHQSIREIDCTMLCDVFEFTNNELMLFIKNITCDENNYCNREMIEFDNENYQELVQELCGERQLVKMQQCFSSMEENAKTVTELTYCNSGGGTRIKIQTASELQLQISTDVKEEKNKSDLRLLRIGIDCHFCFLHINQPVLAFMSTRKDIRSTNLVEIVDNFAKMSIDEKLISTIFTKVDNITWFDEYLSGGSFQTSCKVSLGDLLCIRKEVYNGGDDPHYVWNAHAIVSHCGDGKVEFSVCTLSQAEGNPTDNKHTYCVDIISTKLKQPSSD